MENERTYIKKRIWKSRLQSIPFYLCRIFPIRKNKIVFCCIEGTTGYTCNPKYIAEELLRRNIDEGKEERFELVWLVNDMSKEFPGEIKKIHNTLWNRAYHLTTACMWIDNSRKQLETRKRRGQIYIQTWHAKLGFKPTCLDRGASFTEIAYLVSKHDSDMVDYWLSNSDWYDNTLPTGSIYTGKTLRTGSPRCDILVRAAEDNKFKEQIKKKILKQDKNLSDVHFLMYAPTFRGGSQETNRQIAAGQGFPDYIKMSDCLDRRFGGKWYILLRLHPQLVARNLDQGILKENSGIKERIIYVSRVDDMYELLAGCDAFMTDYSSAAFDAAVMKIPVFLYADDYEEYEQERGKLLWDLRELPFPLAVNDKELEEQILQFDEKSYINRLEKLFTDTGMTEDGRAAKYAANAIKKIIFGRHQNVVK